MGAALSTFTGMRKRVAKKKAWWMAGGILGALLLAVGGLNYWVLQSTRSARYTDLRTVPQNEVGLVLGTGRLLKNGTVNWHFRSRVLAAAQLYQAGKVKHLLLSGDNHSRDYDEPTDMKQALLALGVPESAMTLDYAGFRTLDSVVRARKIFGQQQVTLITDDFHCARAVFLARHQGLEAIAFASAEVPVARSFRSRLRECAARVVAVTDTFVVHRQPRFLGQKIEVRVDRTGAFRKAIYSFFIA